MPDFCEMLPHNPCRVRRGAGGGGVGGWDLVFLRERTFDDGTYII